MESKLVSNYICTRDIGGFGMQVCAVFYLATNTNSTLWGFFYHYFIQRYLRLPILNFAVCFVVTFEKLAKTFQFLKAAIQDHISISF